MGVCMRCYGQRNQPNPPAAKRSAAVLWVIIGVLLLAVCALAFLLLHGRGGDGGDSRPGRAASEINTALYYDPVVEQYDTVFRRVSSGESWSVIQSELEPDSPLRSCDYLVYTEALYYARFDVDHNGVDELLIGVWNDYYEEIDVRDILCIDGDHVRHLLPPFTRESLIYAAGDPGDIFCVTTGGEIWFRPSRPLNIDIFGYWKAVVQDDGSLLISEMVVSVYRVSGDVPYDYYHWNNDDPTMTAEDLYEQYFLNKEKEPEMISGTPTDNHEFIEMILGVTDKIEPDWQSF